MTEGEFRGLARPFVPTTKNYSTPATKDAIAFSAVTAVDLQLDTSRFHIALPVKGTEPYQVDGQNFEAGDDEYFIFNPKQKAICQGSFDEVVEGICIFLSPETIRETAQSMELGLSNSLDHPFAFDWQQHEFLVKTYALSENYFGRFLADFKKTLLAVKKGDLVWEDETATFSKLAEAFLKGHHQIGDHLNNIPALKKSTREELYTRLARVHAFIVSSYADKIQIEDLLQVGCISKYHLIRTYKTVYGKTPYQDILHRRLDTAKMLLREGISNEEIAFRLHFTDGKAFGKSFKKRFGITPGKMAQPFTSIGK